MIKRVTFYGLMVSLALIFSYIEFLIPITTTVPGIKIGLANIVIVLTLVMAGSSCAIYISIIRILLVSITFGNFSLFIYSLSGAILSLIVMILAYKTKKLNIFTVSILGSVFHNLGQLITAALLISTFNIMYYLPILMISGIITGFIIGYIVNEVNKRIKLRR